MKDYKSLNCITCTNLWRLWTPWRWWKEMYQQQQRCHFLVVGWGRWVKRINWQIDWINFKLNTFQVWMTTGTGRHFVILFMCPKNRSTFRDTQNKEIKFSKKWCLFPNFNHENNELTVIIANACNLAKQVQLTCCLIKITSWGTFCWLHQATQLWCWSEPLSLFYDIWLEEHIPFLKQSGGCLVIK